MNVVQDLRDEVVRLTGAVEQYAGEVKTEVSGMQETIDRLIRENQNGGVSQTDLADILGQMRSVTDGIISRANTLAANNSPADGGGEADGGGVGNEEPDVDGEIV